ncbi:MAG: hypothetical protein K1X66_01790 [Verrucomicrobiae bacterium]|nr:hypothetical protein [Verrucomicrobiae bacterium]
MKEISHNIFYKKSYWLVAILLWISWGVGKLFLEKKVAHELTPSLNLRVSEQMGQDAVLALFSGFRSVLADGLWLRANYQFEQQQWLPMRENMELVCLLQPRSIFFWEMAAWHLAWNMSHAARYDLKEPSLAKRLKAEQSYILAGRKLLDRGLKNIPDRYELWAARGFLRAEKQKDYEGAAEDFLKAATFPDAPAYVFRQVAYNLERAKKWQEAYAFWLKVWRSFPDKSATPEMRWDRVQAHIERLEEKLHIPQQQKLFPEN